MAGYKKDSPSEFNIFGGGALTNIVKGVKNRDEYGGGLKGAIKGTVGEFTGGTAKNRNEEINSKLDEIISGIAALGGADDGTGAPDISTTSPAAAPLAMATPAKFSEFMSTTQQAPVSNNTGGKNPTFNPKTADRIMAVADPNVDTKGALFMRNNPHTPPSVAIGPVVGRDSTSTEKLYVTGDKRGWGKETMKYLEDKIWDQRVDRSNKEKEENTNKVKKTLKNLPTID